MRLDQYLVAQGVESRSRAQRLIAEGRVRVDGAVATRGARRVPDGARLDIDDDPWVSRAAHKLLAALDAAQITPAGRALDIGASTGGFTQVLRDRGCTPVYAVDVGHGQLHPRIAADPGVVNLEGRHADTITLADLDGEPADVVTIDVSFISVTRILPLLAPLARPGALVVTLVKPQFELSRAALNSQGVVRDHNERARAIATVRNRAAELGFAEEYAADAALAGEAGNREHVLMLRLG